MIAYSIEMHCVVRILTEIDLDPERITYKYPKEPSAYGGISNVVCLNFGYVNNLSLLHFLGTVHKHRHHTTWPLQFSKPFKTLILFSDLLF